MYTFLSKISAWLSQPLTSMAYSTDIALWAAFVLGIIGSVAPCQISANVGAITYFGNRELQQKLLWMEIVLYLLGKIVVFSMFGIIFWVFKESVSNYFIPFFVIARKLLGPLFIIIGFFLIGWLRLPGNIGFTLSSRLSQFSKHVGGKWGSFLMGIAFSLGFCPTMFWLFFGILMPLSLKSGAGVVLPSIFAVGTAIPLLVFSGLFIGFGLDRMMVNKTKKWGGLIQKIAGMVLVLWGISDTYTYWTL